MADVVLENVVKKYGAIEAVKGISLVIPDGKFVALVGPSGCGKTTTLRMIAGLDDITDGDILIGGEVMNDIAPKNRDIAMVFQSYALYPHMTVYDNMSFGLRLRGLPKTEIRSRVEDAARILDIGELLDRKPRQLSGGQRQRVAMGRAIVRQPKVFLFDEPLSNLDAKLRVQMRTEIKRIHQKVRTTTVYVTHDQIEAMTLADFVVVMNRGVIEQVGSPHDLYHSPKTRFVAGFIGSPAMNFLDGRLEPAGPTLAVALVGGPKLRIPPDRAVRYQTHIGKPMLLGLRPEHLTEPWSDAPGEGAEFTVKIDVAEPMGLETMLFFSMGGTEVCARVEPGAARGPGETMALRANMSHMHLIDPASGLVV